MIPIYLSKKILPIYSIIILLIVTKVGNTQSLVGTWKNQQIPAFMFEFKDNGEYLFKDGQSQNVLSGTFRVNGIYINWQNISNGQVQNSVSTHGFLDANTLMLINQNLQQSIWQRTNQSIGNSVITSGSNIHPNSTVNQECNGVYYFQGAIGDDRIQQFNEFPVQIQKINNNQYLIENSFTGFKQNNEIIVPGNQIPGFPYRHRIVITLFNGGCDGAHYSKSSSLKMEGKIYKNKPSQAQTLQNNTEFNYHNSALCSCCNGSGKGRESSCSRCSVKIGRASCRERV
mgnify:FL=1